MLRLFRTKYEKELDSIIDEININCANNYKSIAHAARIKLGQRSEEFCAEGKIDVETYKKYHRIYEEYTEKLKNYHH